MTAAMHVSSLPLDIAGEVMKRADQETRVACLTVCKAWHAAAMLPTAWASVRFDELDATAVDFVCRQPGVRHVHVHTRRPDDVVHFFDALADAGLGAQLESVHLTMGPIKRLPGDMLCALSRHSGLRTLDMDIASIERLSEVAFPPDHGLTNLRRLRIHEHGGVTRQLVVWFNGTQSCFGALEHVFLAVGVSDVMVGVDDMKALRHLTYLCDELEGGETYEDVNLEGADLDHLELEIGEHTDFGRLWRQLQRASVRTLVLHLNDEFLGITEALSPDLRRLVLGFRADYGDVELDFRCLREHHPSLEKVTVGVTADWILSDADILNSCEHTLVFRHIPSFSQWLAYVTKVQLDVAPRMRVCMTPARA